jgi:hypothetical protein
MLVLGIIIVLLTALMLIKLKLCVEYSDGNLFVLAQAGPVKFKILPVDKEKKEKKKEKKREKKKLKKPKKPKKKRQFDITDLLNAAIKTLKRFKRRFVIEDFTLHYTAGSDDPADTAVNFAYFSAILYNLGSLLENSFKAKNIDIKTRFDFNLEKPVYYFRLKTAIALWAVIYIGIGLLIGILFSIKGDTKDKTKRKVDLKNG